MPIDPRIPLGAQTPSVQSPLALLSEFAQLRAQQQSLQERQLEMADRTKQRRDTQAIKDVFALTPKAADGSYDLDRIAGEAMLVDPNTGLKLQDEASQRKRQGVSDQNAQLEQVQKRIEFIGRAAGAVLDAPPEARPQVYAQQRQQLIRDKVVSPEQVPEAYDEQFVTSKFNDAKTMANRIAEQAAKQRELTAKNLVPKDFYLKGDRKTRVPGGYDPDTNSYYVTGSKAPLQAGTFELAPPLGTNSGDDATHWAEVTDTLPDGTKVTRSVRAGNGQVLKTTPPSEGAKAITPAQRQAAERWKANELRRIEERYRKDLAASKDSQGFVAPPSEDDLLEDKLRTENGYRAQLGLDPVTELGAAWTPTPKAAPQAVKNQSGGSPFSAGASPSSAAPRTTPPTASAAQPSTNPGSNTPQNQTAKPAANTQRMSVGQAVLVKGKRYIVGKVYPDGSWDPK